MARSKEGIWLSGAFVIVAALIGAWAQFHAGGGNNDHSNAPAPTVTATVTPPPDNPEPSPRPTGLPSPVTPAHTVLTGDSSGTDNGDGRSWALDVTAGTYAPHTRITLWFIDLQSAGKQWKFIPVDPTSHDHHYMVVNGKNPENTASPTVLTYTPTTGLTLETYEKGNESQQWLVDGNMLQNTQDQRCLAYGGIQKYAESLRRAIDMATCGQTNTNWRLPDGL